MAHYVYKITNLTTGKVYVGCTAHLERRLVGHRGGRPEILGEHYSVQVLETLPTRREALTREAHFIRTLNATDPKIGYNREPRFSAEARKLLKESAKRLAKASKALSPTSPLQRRQFLDIEVLAREIEALEADI